MVLNENNSFDFLLHLDSMDFTQISLRSGNGFGVDQIAATGIGESFVLCVLSNLD